MTYIIETEIVIVSHFFDVMLMWSLRGSDMVVMCKCRISTFDLKRLKLYKKMKDTSKLKLNNTETKIIKQQIYMNKITVFSIIYVYYLIYHNT